MGALKCDGMNAGCTEDATWIDRKGFVYCEKCGLARRASGTPARKLLVRERKTLEANLTINYEKTSISKEMFFLAVSKMYGSLTKLELRTHCALNVDSMRAIYDTEMIAARVTELHKELREKAAG